MIYRKFRADSIFTGTAFSEPGKVLITDENGRVEGLIAAKDAGDPAGIQDLNGTLSPGFVNAHCHLELSWMKGTVPKQTGMVDFLLSVMKTSRPEPRIMQLEIEKAEEAMLREGIVAVGDISNTTITIKQKQQGNLYYHNFIEAMGFVEASAGQRFQQAADVYAEFAKSYDLPNVSNSIVPHSPYSVSPALFEKITSFPGNLLLSIHNQENEAENEFFISGTGDFHRLFKNIGVDSSFHKGSGRSSVQNFLPRFKRNQVVLLVHNVETNRDDLAFIKKQNERGVHCWLCLCPNANQYINGRLPDLELINETYDHVVLGTDSLASNDHLSIMEEIKTINRAAPSIPVTKLLEWATLNGAKALDIADEAGSFEKGKQPGIVLLSGVTKEAVMEDAKSERVL